MVAADNESLLHLGSCDNDQSSLLQKNEELTRDMESSSTFTAESRATIAKLQHALELAKQVISLTWSRASDNVLGQQCQTTCGHI